MARGNTVEVRFAGEASGFNRVVKQVAENSEDSAGRMRRAFDKTGEAADASESKFMAMADVLDGLGGAFGLPTEGATNMMRAFGDLSGGFAILQPVIASAKGAFAALNATLLANPIFLIVAALAALGIAFYIAYQKSETFRNIVDGAFRAIRTSAEWVVNWISWAWDWLFDKLRGPVTAYVGFYRSVFSTIIDVAKWVFNSVAGLWNSGPGKIGFTVPTWVPVVGGKRFDIPDIPMLAEGGIVTKPTLAMIGEAGPEAVVPLSRSGAMGPTVHVTVNALDPKAAADAVVKALESHFARGGAVAGPAGRTLRPT